MQYGCRLLHPTYQRIRHGHAFADVVHDHGVQIDFRDRVGVVGGELAEPDHQGDEGVDSYLSTSSAGGARMREARPRAERFKRRSPVATA